MQRPDSRRVHNERSKDFVTASRYVAFNVLLAVTESDAYANILLPHRIVEAGLDSQEAALATELTYGTLRWQGLYDAIIARVSSRELDSIETRALVVLRLGAHQLLAMRTTAHAAVDQSVMLARKRCGESIAKFVNAVLRRVSEKSRDEWIVELTENAASAADALAVVHSHPAWIVRAFRDALSRGRDVSTPEVHTRIEAELLELLETDNAGPAVTLSRLDGDSTKTTIELTGEDGSTFATEPCDYSPVGLTLSRGGNPATIAQFGSGLLRVQDEGSQLAGQVLVNAQPVQTGEAWLDLCAAPGGKAALIASRGVPMGVTLTAVELHPARAKLVESALAPFEGVHVVCQDGVAFGREHSQEFDRILVDAPCTGLGSLRRRPESRWRKTPHDVGQLTALQANLLNSAISALKPGGLICYVTCSPHLAETRGIIDSTLRKNPSIRELPVRPVLDSFTRKLLPDTGEGPSVQLWPHKHGTDAMFISLLTKVE